MIKLFNFLLVAGALQGFIFNVFTFLSRKKIEKPVLFLNLLVLFLSLNNLQSWVMDTFFTESSAFYIKYCVVPWYVLIVPMFYAFLVYYLGIEKSRWPFLIVSIVIFMLELGARTIVLTLAFKGDLNEVDLSLYHTLEDAVTLIYSLFLLFKCVQSLYGHNAEYIEILTYDNLKWIKNLLKVGGLVICLWIIAVALNLFSETIRAPYSYYPLRLGSSIFLYWIGYQGFFRYVILKDRIMIRRDLQATLYDYKPKEIKNMPNLAKSEQEEQLYTLINSRITAEGLFMNPNLGLDAFAENLGVKATKISHLINTYSDYNFSDHINHFRVAEAKKLLIHPDFSNYTIISIGLECGFNSKSTFYTAFKKFTGMTPSAWRKNAFSLK
jgi:AraC-like DNA-binding protein